MKIINGRKIAQEIKDELKKEIAKSSQMPGLAVILIGSDEASRLYIKIKEKAAKELGIMFCKYIFSAQAGKKEVLETIDWLNQDGQINGILLQMPLPDGWDSERLIKKIMSQKDIDGLKNKKFTPPFIGAIIKALEKTEVDLKDKKIVALVNSDIFGKKLCAWCQKKGWSVRYIIVKSKAMKQSHKILRDPSVALGDLRTTKSADVLISACGRPNFIKGAMIKKGSILIDGGISKKGDQVIGDIDIKSVGKKVEYLAPVPGGLGPITVAMLFKNLLLAKK